jgi:hypothetical protein
MLSCSVIRTHRRGEPLRDRDLTNAIKGTVRMQSIHHPALKRMVSMLTMCDRAHFGAVRQPKIPDLLEPKLLTFGSDRGMMVCGFEEIDGQRFYQGWWITWE